MRLLQCTRQAMQVDFLIVKQHVKFTLHRRFVCWAEAATDTATVHVASLESVKDITDQDEKQRDKVGHVGRYQVRCGPNFLTWHVCQEIWEGRGQSLGR